MIEGDRGTLSPGWRRSPSEQAAAFLQTLGATVPRSPDELVPPSLDDLDRLLDTQASQADEQLAAVRTAIRTPLQVLRAGYNEAVTSAAAEDDAVVLAHSAGQEARAAARRRASRQSVGVGFAYLPVFLAQYFARANNSRPRKSPLFKLRWVPAAAARHCPGRVPRSVFFEPRPRRSLARARTPTARADPRISRASHPHWWRR